jgi:hypothetical protein
MPDKIEKPTHVKPSFYAFLFESLKVIAKNFGYNLVLNGSMNRDLDLIAIPWIDEPKDRFELIVALDKVESNNTHNYQYQLMPGGRHGYIINIRRNVWKEEEFYDAKYYLDISVTPLPG